MISIYFTLRKQCFSGSKMLVGGARGQCFLHKPASQTAVSNYQSSKQLCNADGDSNSGLVRGARSQAGVHTAQINLHRGSLTPVAWVLRARNKISSSCSPRNSIHKFACSSVRPSVRHQFQIQAIIL